MKAEGYVELAFEAEAGTAEPDDDVLKAAERFDKTHLTLTTAARQHIIDLEYYPSALHLQSGYRTTMRALVRNRYFVP
jgi:hypothetical protein